MAEASKKRKDSSLQEKQIILECYDKLPTMIQRSAAVRLKILQPLLCKILKNRSDNETLALNIENADRKTARSGEDSQVESALKNYLVMFVKRLHRLMGLLCVKKQNLLKLWAKNVQCN
jgi:hypothetical protein